jgi:hypothetical protein
MASTKITQNIETGGTNNTATPMLKFRMKALLVDNEARHMTHWASVESALNAISSAAANRIAANLAFLNEGRREKPQSDNIGL